MQIGEYIESLVNTKGGGKVKTTSELGWNRNTFNGRIKENSFTIPEYIELCNYLHISPVQYFDLIKNEYMSEELAPLTSEELKALRRKKSEKKSDSEVIHELIRQNGALIDIINKLTDR